MSPAIRPVLVTLYIAAAALWTGLVGLALTTGGIDAVIALVLGLSVVALTVSAFWLAPRASRMNYAILFAMIFGASYLGCAGFSGGHSKASAKKASCLSNLKRLSRGLLEYAVDHDDHLPPAGVWRDQAKVEEWDYGDVDHPKRRFVDGSTIRCPSAKSPWSYALNAGVAAALLPNLSDPAVTVLLFEAEVHGPNAAGGPEFFTIRHGESGAITFADGHAKAMNRKSANELVWEPKAESAGAKKPGPESQ